ncbi:MULTISPECIES: nickel/cobalt transporter [unclassified Fibrobacter]|uniref:nickel/cobalt transporter n=1 Tax=unclassified Fibrobacter TaxID=2634177 RepID=UPI000D6B24EB|nr:MULTISPECIES: hypothetical protein [unclassified Fibrobacter]PWJ71816.1 ABC-type nickel/cobalt efflux system permease component RcnA [Fibrobacter sp. UWR4]PZW73731.1 ABC-type nickel/cobalt efflux system permease component RcnA [Fibrobacter sp. UWR1]
MVFSGRFNFFLAFVLTLFLVVGGSAAVKKKRFDVENVKDTTSVVVSPNDAPVAESGFSLLAALGAVQKNLRETLSGQINAMKAGKNSAVWYFIAVCFLYGLLHALGPGHGKSIVVGFFLARRGRWRQGVALGAGITFTHTMSAVVILFVLYLFLKTAVFPAFEVGRGGIEKISYAMLVFTGLVLIFFGIKDFLKRRKESSYVANTMPAVASWKEIIGVAAITGIVPCPAVALIVLFCLLNSMIVYALVGAFVICVGMMVTNISFGVAAVAFRKGIDKKSRSSRFASKIYMIASIAGGVLVTTSGVLLLHNTFVGQC